MSKHTPGPWGIHAICGEDGAVVTTDSFDVLIFNIGSGEVLIGSVEAYDHRGNAYAGYPTPDFEQCKANARLIASAPELLEVAKQVMAWWDVHQHDTCGEYDDYYVYETDPDLVVAARAAIAKATGEQQ